MHFKRGLAKVVLGICRGKQQHDKREAMKTAQAKRDIQRQMAAAKVSQDRTNGPAAAYRAATRCSV